MRSIVAGAFLLTCHDRVVVVLGSQYSMFYVIVPPRGIYGSPSSLEVAMQCFFLPRCLNGSTLWKWQNEFVFNASCLPLAEAYKINTAWAAYFVYTCVSLRPHPTPTLIYHQWKKPLLATGFLCVGKVSTIQAELWSIYVGLQVSWNFGTTRLAIQSDSSQAIKLVRDPSAMRHSMQLDRAIDAWRLKHWSLNFQWIPREMNMVADCLSKLVPPSQYQLKVFVDEPDVVCPLIIRDVEGPPYGRPCRDSHSVC
ncbi:hypothetical protein V6N12_023644 [Hibiscus sabdariffa]|uniref:RNase H type-1 domain-containing protein n=1 Tax=Hibiscus sabdariffa TaxID=183260 RepID=A0ABR2FY86_9ROSI